jgi:hypothetical protein
VRTRTKGRLLSVVNLMQKGSADPRSWVNTCGKVLVFISRVHIYFLVLRVRVKDEGVVIYDLGYKV